jgi:protein subunit release factor A
MENFGRLSNRALSVTCPCGIVFETYDLKKVYHSNKCRAFSIMKRNVVNMQRKRLKQKKLKKYIF